MGVQPNQLNMTGGVTSPRGVLSYEVVLEEAKRPKTPRPTSARTRPSSASSISSMEDIKKEATGSRGEEKAEREKPAGGARGEEEEGRRGEEQKRSAGRGMLGNICQCFLEKFVGILEKYFSNSFQRIFRRLFQKHNCQIFCKHIINWF